MGVGAGTPTPRCRGKTPAAGNLATKHGKLAPEPSPALGASVANPPLDREVPRRADRAWPERLAQQAGFANKDLKINVALQ